MFYPYPLEADENPVLSSASQLLADGFNPQSLYPANLAAPYRLANYGPVFYFLNALLMALLGPHKLLAGRLLGLGATFGLILLSFRLARREEIAAGRKAGIGISLAAALTPLATLAFYRWGAIARPDTLTLLWSVLAVERVWRATAESERRRSASLQPYILAGLLCGLALLTRQTAIAAPLAITLWLALRLRWRDCGIFLGTLVGSLTVVGLVFQTLGGHFLRHLISYNLAGFDLGRLLAGLGYFGPGHAVLVGLAVVWATRPFVGRFERVDLWRVYFLTALIGGLLCGFGEGDTNFWLESLWLTALLAWWQLGRVLSLRPTVRLGDFRPEVAPVLLGLVVLQLLYLYHFPILADPLHTDTATNPAQADSVAAILRERQGVGPILAESSGWLTTQGWSAEVDAPAEFGLLAQRDEWHEQPFLDRLKSGYYKTVFFELTPPGSPTNLTSLDALLQSETGLTYPARFSPSTLSILQDRTKFVPYKRVGRWLFLVWQG